MLMGFAKQCAGSPTRVLSRWLFARMHYSMWAAEQPLFAFAVVPQKCRVTLSLALLLEMLKSTECVSNLLLIFVV